MSKIHRNGWVAGGKWVGFGKCCSMHRKKTRRRCHRCERLTRTLAERDAAFDEIVLKNELLKGLNEGAGIELKFFRDLLGSLVDDFMVRRTWTPPTEPETPTVEASFK